VSFYNIRMVNATMCVMSTIGILIERQRTYGRRRCEGIIRFARERTNWTLSIVDFMNLPHIAHNKDIDGFIASVSRHRMKWRFSAQTPLFSY
ncbi:MAG: hypothetical protein IKJ37_11700, partial [Kiritimatiellae bacterium]|nr:hypothetical protein [Kiritimatiellia bacterium]